MAPTLTEITRPTLDDEPTLHFHQEKADVFVPDGSPVLEALSRTTHLGILSHQDDLEIGAYHGIAECFRSTRRWFAGVVVSDGGGSPRAGAYAHFTDEEMKDVRRIEQRKAAYVGEYGSRSNSPIRARL